MSWHSWSRESAAPSPPWPCPCPSYLPAVHGSGAMIRFAVSDRQDTGLTHGWELRVCARIQIFSWDLDSLLLAACIGAGNLQDPSVGMCHRLTCYAGLWPVLLWTWR